MAPRALTSMESSTPPTRHELAFSGARVIDPSSGLDTIQNVDITAGTITAVRAAPIDARDVVDVTGDVLAPGVVDLHSHTQTTIGVRLQALDGVTTALHLEAGVLATQSNDRPTEAGGLINHGCSASRALARIFLFDRAPSVTDGLVAISCDHPRDPAPLPRRQGSRPDALPGRPVRGRRTRYRHTGGESSWQQAPARP